MTKKKKFRPYHILYIFVFTLSLFQFVFVGFFLFKIRNKVQAKAAEQGLVSQKFLAFHTYTTNQLALTEQMIYSILDFVLENSTNNINSAKMQKTLEIQTLNYSYASIGKRGAISVYNSLYFIGEPTPYGILNYADNYICIFDTLRGQVFYTRSTPTPPPSRPNDEDFNDTFQTRSNKKHLEGYSEENILR